MTHNFQTGYPRHWPEPDPHKPYLVRSRITELQKFQLYHRLITTRQLAKDLDIAEKYLSSMFPGKVPIVDKRPLTAARKAIKLELAKDVLLGKLSLRQASEQLHVSYSTMLRIFKEAKKLNPELTDGYQKTLSTLRKNNIEKARNVRRTRL